MRKRYLTGLFEGEPKNYPPPLFKGRGWHVEFKNRVVRLGKGRDEQRDPRGMGMAIATQWHDDGTFTVTDAPEIIICHDTRIKAQKALNLITAAYPMVMGGGTLEDMTAFPEDERELEDLPPYIFDHAVGTKHATSGMVVCCAIAAKASHRKRWIYAISKLWVSSRICSVEWMELHPKYGTRFGVEQDPLNHASFAQAIVSAYAAIEELELEIRASRNNPSRINGRWNPTVLTNLQKRLTDAGIDLSKTFVWNLRNTRTRVEQNNPPPTGDRAPWARHLVRDRLVKIEDAILYASYLRSRVSAHRSSSGTRSLTIYDVNNVQTLARRLVLETMGFWPPF